MNDHPSSSADSVFDAYLARVDRGEPVDFEGLCAAHPALARELCELRDRCAILAKLMPGPLEEPPPADPLLDRLRAAGARGARYVERGEVAQGGMGIVLRVWDDELERQLAMKVVRRNADDPRTLRRFLAEARITSQLDHPSIVPVHEIGLRQDGTVYYTMRLVEGRDLSAVFDAVVHGQDGWTLARAVDVLVRVCQAMSFAHSRRVIHRDLKPANVMVGQFGEVYVMDWGLARVVDEPDPHDVRLQTPSSSGAEGSPLLTRDGVAVGTPSYMAPEQARGEIERLGPRADVYSVGAMLYHLLTGTLPFAEPGESPSSALVLERLRQGPPSPLSRLGRSVPAELVAICERAMARDLAARYASMQELGDDLRAFAEKRVVAAYETGTWAETRKWVRRNPGLAAALLGVVGLTVVGAGIAVSASEARARAEAAERLAEPLLATAQLGRLVTDADRLWPPIPALISRLEAWLETCDVLLHGPIGTSEVRAPGVSLAAFRVRLSQARSRALPVTEAELREDYSHHPRRLELEMLQRDLAWRSRMLDLEPWPVSAAASSPSISGAAHSITAFASSRRDDDLDPEEWRQFAYLLVDPDKPSKGEESLALEVASFALERAQPEQRPQALLTHAWALWRSGRVAEARRECELAGRDIKDDPRGVDKLRRATADWDGEVARTERHRERDALAERLRELEKEVRARRTFRFEDAQDEGWHALLARLVDDMERLAAPGTGLMTDAVAEPFGWGIARRLAFARTVSELSLDGPEAARAWAEAIAAIRASPRYAGLELRPQLGLLPIGADPASGLWEFAHLQSGAIAVRGQDGRVVLDDAMGLVFVLVPGGTFDMGAQRHRPTGRNHDPQALGEEWPVRRITLSPFFLSKFEMTASQWLRIAGRNPSYFDPKKVLGDHRPFPVENVSWDDCQVQLPRLGLKLPSEAQWEYACRAGTDTPWFCGGDRETLRGKVNLADQSAKRVGMRWPSLQEWPDLDDHWISEAPVGAFAANGFGLHDMLGNVAEWCLDDHAQYTLWVRVDPIVSDGHPVRVQRGGNFVVGPSQARCSYRASATPNSRNSAVGVRPARAID